MWGKKSGKSVYDIIAEKLVSLMDQTNLLPWQMPWKKIKGKNSCAGFVSGATGKEYDFLNNLLLFIQGGEEGRYFTFNGAKKLGMQIKKGAKGKIIKGSTVLDREMRNENGELVRDKHGRVRVEKVFVLRYWTVFHESDIEGYENKEPELPPAVPLMKVESAEVVSNNYLSREKITLVRGGNKAFFRPSEDLIQLPEDGQFEGKTNEFYSTLFHEMVHSTGTENRLNRKSLVGATTTENYAKDELCAEIGAAYLCGLTDTASESSLNNSAAYIKTWKERITKDPKALVIAFAQAEKAVNFIVNGRNETGDGDE